MRAAVGLLALALAACGGAGAPANTPDGIGAIVLVSGRDDHGLLQMAQVPLHGEPEGTIISGQVPDGAFAEVLEIRGTWLRIRAVAEPSLTGWIDDFFLRNRAVLQNSQQVRFVAAQGGNPVRIEVQLVEGDAPPFWVEAQQLVEVGADVEPHDH